jgi:deoxyribodipyrimidine photolyase-related protein
VRTLAVILGDQLSPANPAIAALDRTADLVWMCESREESTHVPSHKARTALFLSAMRHFREYLRASGFTLRYHELQPRGLAEQLSKDLAELAPDRVVVTHPGDYRTLDSLRRLVPSLEVFDDPHFLATPREFAAHAKGRTQLRMEYFYREMRRRHDVLMDEGQPAGGQWNFDADNRSAFPKSGPGRVPSPPLFEPDAITREVLELVEREFPGNPGRLDQFAWAVTPAQARAVLDDFIARRLPLFGRYQDAMWMGEPYLWHSLLSSSLNLHLLDPREVISAAERAYRTGQVPLAAAEGFIRQILGWREYVRGVYWLHMPGYLQRNSLQASKPLPDFYWTGDTDMNCLRETITQTLDSGYAHHIQRLMVTGLYALLEGVDPRQVHEWYLSVYVDAVEWVELPNTLGMSQYADGGVMASKPYVASGKYIERMSNYCKGCRYDPATDCPFTVKYWQFLERNAPALKKNPRMTMQLKNLAARKAKA